MSRPERHDEDDKAAAVGPAPSNADLTESERSRKQRLKRWLQWQIRVRKMEHRVLKAKDQLPTNSTEDDDDDQTTTTTAPATASLLADYQDDLIRAREALVRVAAEFEDDAYDDDFTHPATAPVVHPLTATRTRRDAHALIVSTYHRLQRALPENDRDDADDDDDAPSHDERRERRHRRARALLRNMTRATQRLDMFRDAAALRGYVRRKFIRRAAVVSTTLSLLTTEPKPHRHDHHHDHDDDDDHGDDDRDEEASYVNQTCRLLGERLQCLDTVVSIGCGPGCDALGIAAWFQASQRRRQPQEQLSSSPPRAVLLDWAVSEWRHPILDALRDLIVPTLYRRVDAVACDVSVPWKDAVNAAARERVFSPEDDDDDDEARATTETKTTLFVTSYLLSETRGRWETFYREIWDEAAPGSLWLFTDPTAWQLKVWLSQRNHDGGCGCAPLVYTWLDSSMHHPALQVLEKRVGPAALLAMKPWK